MKYTLIIGELPYPKYKSGVADTVNHLIYEWIKAGIIIDLIYYGINNGEGESYYNELGCRVIHIDITRAAPRAVLAIQPSDSARYDYTKFNYGTLIKSDGIMLVGFNSLFLLNKLHYEKNVKVAYFALDCLSLYYKRSGMNSEGLIAKAYYYYQYKIVQAVERKYYRKVNSVFFVSNVDKNYCKVKFKRLPEILFKNIVLGVEIPQMSAPEREPLSVGFSGIMDYKPNLEAGNFILDEVAPPLIQKYPDCKIYLIGKNAPPHFYEQQKKYPDNIIVTGFVDDINLYIARLSIYLSPLFVGTGMKNKILQAMALGTPLICTTTSREGIEELIDGRNFLLCNATSASEWLVKIERLFKEDGMRAKFEQETKNIVMQNYDWTKIALDFTNQFQEN